MGHHSTFSFVISDCSFRAALLLVACNEPIIDTRWCENRCALRDWLANRPYRSRDGYHCSTLWCTIGLCRVQSTFI